MHNASTCRAFVLCARFGAYTGRPECSGGACMLPLSEIVSVVKVGTWTNHVTTVKNCLPKIVTYMYFLTAG